MDLSKKEGTAYAVPSFFLPFVITICRHRLCVSTRISGRKRSSFPFFPKTVCPPEYDELLREKRQWFPNPESFIIYDEPHDESPL